jgi:hypothetical protein
MVGGRSFGPAAFRGRQYGYVDASHTDRFTLRRVATFDTSQNQYLTRGSTANLNVLGFRDSGGAGVTKFTFSFVIEFATLFDGQTLIGKFTDGTTGGSWLIRLSAASGKRIDAYFWTGASTIVTVTLNSADASIAFVTGEPYHFWGQYDGSQGNNNGKLKLWVNDIAMAMDSPTATTLPANLQTGNTEFNIGRGWTSHTAGCVNGRMSDVYLWNGIRGNTARQAVYAGGAMKSFSDFAALGLTDVVAGWRLNEAGTQTDLGPGGLDLIGVSGAYADQVVSIVEESPFQYLLQAMMPYERIVKRRYEPDWSGNGLASGVPAIVGRLNSYLLAQAVDWSNETTGHVWGNVKQLVADNGEYFWLETGDDRTADFTDRHFLCGGFGPTSSGTSGKYTQITRYDCAATGAPALSPPTAPNYWPNGSITMLNGGPGTGMNQTAPNVSVAPGTACTVEHASVYYGGVGGHDTEPGPHRIRIDGVDQIVNVADGGNGSTLPYGWLTRVPNRQYWGLSLGMSPGGSAGYALSHFLALAPSIGDANARRMCRYFMKQRGA